MVKWRNPEGTPKGSVNARDLGGMLGGLVPGGRRGCRGCAGGLVRLSVGAKIESICNVLREGQENLGMVIRAVIDLLE